jgi:hypothetical protein
MFPANIEFAAAQQPMQLIISFKKTRCLLRHSPRRIVLIHSLAKNDRPCDKKTLTISSYSIT